MYPFLHQFALFLHSNGIQREKVTHVKLHQSESRHCTILSQSTEKVAFKEITSLQQDLHMESKPATKPTDDPLLPLDDKSYIFDIYGKTDSSLTSYINSICTTQETVSTPKSETKQREIRKIVDNGDQSNRIDVVFMGDGYTSEEKDQFFDDMDRLTQDMFNDVTFRSYLPVFNIWAIFEPSVESGIGYNGAKNTPFRLYRAAGQLRGIYTGNAAYARQICALTGASGCDYPSLIGNDDFYGGLGGEFVISTKSERTGTVVLRHEMGHNFVNVGEEYDGGSVYRGVNSASSLATVGWSHWVTDELREENSIIRIQDYRWEDLSVEDQYFNFTSDGTYNRWYLHVSVSAAGEADCLEFTLDGEILPWTSSGYDDREFYDWYGFEGLSAGPHSVMVRSKTDPTHPFIPRMICAVRLHEFGTESEFEMDNAHVSAYPTWDNQGRLTYRPTNAGCLMRNMTHRNFCEVCQEGMWHQFFMRIGIIDNLTIAEEMDPTMTRKVTVHTLGLGQLRDPEDVVDGEHLEIRWFYENMEYSGLRDQFTIDARVGNWRVDVKLITPEVRSDPEGLLEDSQTFIV